MKLAVIGVGYVGLVSGACFADYGNDVICVDNNIEKIQLLNKGVLPIYEPNLVELVTQNLESGTLAFTDDIRYAIENSDLCFICVGTPPNDDGTTDMKYITQVANSLGKYINHEMIIINKSTVPVGTAEEVKNIISSAMKERKEDFAFHMVSNPEFLKEGTAVFDCMRPDRIIVGADHPQTVKIMYELYKPFIKKSDSFFSMDIKSAEMTKYAANAMLAAKISFINEISNICERLGADVNKVRIGIGSDHRIGYAFIYPGIGYGGSCFPKDVRSLARVAEQAGYTPQMINAIESVNNSQKLILFEKIRHMFGDNLSGLSFAIWGLSFKPNTDDIRESPSIATINELISHGASVKVYDPKAIENAKKYFAEYEKNINYVNNKYEALVDMDALLLVTEWKEFLSPDFSRIKKLLKRPLIFDGRNQYDSEKLASIGIEYYQIGVR